MNAVWKCEEGHLKCNWSGGGEGTPFKPRWMKLATFIARDDLIRHAEENSWAGDLRRDLFNVSGMDTEEPPYSSPG